MYRFYTDVSQNTLIISVHQLIFVKKSNVIELSHKCIVVQRPDHLFYCRCKLSKDNSLPLTSQTLSCFLLRCTNAAHVVSISTDDTFSSLWSLCFGHEPIPTLNNCYLSSLCIPVWMCNAFRTWSNKWPMWTLFSALTSSLATLYRRSGYLMLRLVDDVVEKVFVWVGKHKLRCHQPNKVHS